MIVIFQVLRLLWWYDCPCGPKKYLMNFVPWKQTLRPGSSVRLTELNVRTKAKAVIGWDSTVRS